PGFKQGIVPGRLGADQSGSVYTNPFGSGGRCDFSCTKADIPNESDGYKACDGFNYPITVWRAATYTPVFDSGYLYQVTSVNSNQALKAASSSVTGGQVVTGSPSSGDSLQRFQILPSGSDWKIVLAANNGICLDDNGQN